MTWCPECGEKSYRIDVCTNCGLVFEDKPIDYTPPQQLEDNSAIEKERNRSTFLKGINKRTKINIKQCKNPNLKRALKKYYYDWKDKRESVIKKELKRIIELLGLSKDFYASAFYNFIKICKLNEISSTNIFRGGGKVSLEIVAQGIAYLEIKKQKLPYTLFDFEKIECDVKKIKQFYSRLITILNLKVEQQQPETFVTKIVSGICLSPREEFLVCCASKNFIKNILKIEEAIGSSTLFRNPIVKAAACIYILTSENFGVTQKDLCEIVGCDVRTLRKRIYETKEILKTIFSYFGFKDNIFEEALKECEYSSIIENACKIYDIDGLLLKGLINPKYEMKLKKTKNNLKAEFYET